MVSTSAPPIGPLQVGGGVASSAGGWQRFLPQGAASAQGQRSLHGGHLPGPRPEHAGSRPSSRQSLPGPL